MYVCVCVVQLLDFMAEMDPKASWCVCGNSIGGLLSLMVTQAAPSKVKGVVLFNSAGGLTSFRDEELPWFLRPLWIFVRVVLFGGECSMMLGHGTANHTLGIPDLYPSSVSTWHES